MESVLRHGPNVIKAHLKHLGDHGQEEYLRQAVEVLTAKGLPHPLAEDCHDDTRRPHEAGAACPGVRSRSFGPAAGQETDRSAQRPSRLTHWPVQLHLISPTAPHYQGADVLLSADCVACTLGGFHRQHLNGKSLAIACPKLDRSQEVYVEKIRALIDDAKINTLTVMIMEVPCCMGLLQLATEAARQATRTVPVKCLVAGIQGNVLKDEWIPMPSTPGRDS
jgi:hypothetical protein